ncbi:MAG: hypothetical protein KDA80_14785, partial [Planctomycetaceae bacterium]|nr:hypothetical protein [Planctomycetaceae bacterium]
MNRSHGGWFTLVFATTLVASLAYLWYATHESNGPTGGSWQGLWFGIAGTSCMVFAGLLSGRKQLPGANLRPVSWWLKGHLWIGLLSVPFILFHTGGRFGGTLEKLLMAVFFLVIASGIWGVLMQHYLPRFLSTMVPAQAITE